MTASRGTHFWGWCLWIALAAVRIALVLVPQTGYIHPDEFFQSTEVAAGDIFGLKAHRTWEFTSVHPIRSAAIIYLTSGIPLLILKCIAYCIEGPGTTPPPYLLLVAPRLFACLASFICDYAVYHLSASPAKQHRRLRALQLFASSYVALVFYTRTFSNSVESLLLALLLLCVKNVLQDDKLKLNDGQLKISRRYTAIGALISLGTFNRPTFVCFALPATAFWLFSRIERSVKARKHRTYAQMAQQLAKRALRLASRCLFFSACLIVADTYYFCPEALSTKVLEDPSSLHLVVTPLNFIRYNLNATNLKSHGEHPHFLHLIVNVPLLFNVLGIAALWVSVKILYRRLSFISKLEESQETFTVCKSFDLVASCTVLLPAFALSLPKHQEPRFLIPLLVPMVLVAHRSFSKKLLVVWALANIVCLAFFGFFHQGGLVPCMLRMQQRIAGHMEEGANATVIFTHTYMPPRHLLTVGQDDATVRIFDKLGGEEFWRNSGIAYLGLVSKAYWKYLVAPPSFVDSFPGWFQEKLVKQFSCDFHFSGEHLPQFSYADLADGAVSLTDLREAFSLAVYWVNFPGKPRV